MHMPTTSPLPHLQCKSPMDKMLIKNALDVLNDISRTLYPGGMYLDFISEDLIQASHKMNFIKRKGMARA